MTKKDFKKAFSQYRKRLRSATGRKAFFEALDSDLFLYRCRKPHHFPHPCKGASNALDQAFVEIKYS